MHRIAVCHDLYCMENYLPIPSPSEWHDGNNSNNIQDKLALILVFVDSSFDVSN